MQSINTAEGITHVIGRNSVYDDVYNMYYSGDVVSECPIYIKFFGEDGVNFGGVQRDMFSAFWKEAYTKFFEWFNLLIPMVNPHIELSVYPIFGRIISHAYLVAGYLPVRITLPNLINILLGPKPLSSQILLEAFAVLKNVFLSRKLSYRVLLVNFLTEGTKHSVKIWVPSASNTL